MYTEDTIVAPATPPGKGAVAIVRLSGVHATQNRDGAMASARVDGAPAASSWPRRASRPSNLRRRRPRDVRHDARPGELHGRRCRGIPLSRRAIYRPPGARDGDRSRGQDGRAGRVQPASIPERPDGFTEAEAVADLINIRSESALQQALAQLSGASGATGGALRSGVIAIRAHLEAEIDFADEGLNLPGRKEIAADIARLADGVALLHRQLQARAPRARRCARRDRGKTQRRQVQRAQPAARRRPRDRDRRSGHHPRRYRGIGDAGPLSAGASGYRRGTRGGRRDRAARDRAHAHQRRGGRPADRGLRLLTPI